MSENKTNLDFENMSDEELKKFREQFDPDTIGFNGEEGVNNASD